MAYQKNESSLLRKRIHSVIFEADTFSGALFDVFLLVVIVVSIVVVSMQTVPGIGKPLDPIPTTLVESLPNFWNWIFGGVGTDPSSTQVTEPGKYQHVLKILSWCFTIFFTFEYLLRIYCVRHPLKYIFSFWGIIDLLAFLPDYILCIPFISTLGVQSRSFSVIRSLRLLRVFRIFKLSWFQFEAEDLGNAVWRARAKIVVFLTVVMIIVTVVGTLMYEIEHGIAGSDSQFHSIPEGIYWAIVTMTTVGFGDIVPVTLAGKILSAVLILIGYSLIIVPTGFVSAEIIDAKRKSVTTISCSSCVTEGHDTDAEYCKYCGDQL